MTLRARLALALGLMAAVAAAVVAIAGYRTTADRLYAQVDSSLSTQASRLADPDGRYARLVCSQISRSPDDSDGPDQGQLADLTGTDVQCLDATGTPYASTEATPLPVQPADRLLASSGGSALSYTTTTGERILTIGMVGGGAIQLARELDEVHHVLGALRTRFTLLGLAVTALAMFAGWVIARRVTRPVTTLTAATERIAESGRLDIDVPPGGKDETGRLAHSFATMLDALRHSREQQQRLVQDAGHELRTPLTSLRTNVDVLRRHPDLAPEKLGRVLDDLNAELQELTGLANELVALATEDTEHESSRLVDLADLAHRAAARAQRRTGHPVQVDAVAAPIYARPRQLLRAIDNLLDNAAKFDRTEWPIEVTVWPGSVAVRDHGPGVTASDLPRIFDRFYRAPSARALPGSGLGLAIVRDAAVMHGGEAHVANHPGGGAVFTIELPLATPEPHDAADAAASPVPSRTVSHPPLTQA